MDWDDINDILYDGTKEQITKVRCPDCGSRFNARFYPNTRNTEIACDACGVLIRAHGAAYEPNFYKFGMNPIIGEPRQPREKAVG